MTHSEKNQATKEKILETTLELIKKEGFERVTIRKIATKSETNIALINYYFGSKERLISEAVKVLLNSFQDTFTILDDLSLSPRDRLQSFLIHYVQVILQYPELVSRIIAMGTAPFASQQEYGEFLQTMGFQKVRAAIQEITQESDLDKLMMMITQLFGAIFLPALMKPILESGAGVRVAPIEEQVNFLFGHYFSSK
ncbi:TetR/AcrR family transcriptional regulator [Brevibacillus laterosporus]|uniref:TetR/AcrR family transcriptional regulator n=1 Tax=Brevibacillus laterosporus TaxID=1465 RepID=A0AAP8QC97_BRELA|nr:TetR/AcrR family transcriptional regulator [Brevibacillus laterosporus]MED1664977.1 TetR/AcrR family transcriptional regulator [Brevibacillus laterosporus]MED1668812.1 TetR/AcrR family transcriptional regulator [Brevibacillus laterosporus]MED1716311.1 TetR/AcrR family transcriptional regulator [Brevibacillus laterosporus]PPA84106.1 TetR/AcrR family transcriptional regulator [Brevibacillus laterosporus]PPA88479.1 TetR/AcrR family transcriptional regulator [Brevibacillus laterosporus]